MGTIKEPLDIDFIEEQGRPLTPEDKQISDFIRTDKKKRKTKENNFFDSFGASPLRNLLKN